MFREYKYEFSLLFVVLAFVALSVIFHEQLGIFGDLERFRNYIASFGALAPFIIVVFMALEVVIAPLPGGIPAVVSGALFGPFLGTIYVATGNILGSFLAFWIARKFGRRLVLYVVKEEKLNQFALMVGERQNIFWVFYFIPSFPLDILTFAIGLSSIPFKRFSVIISIGFVVSSLLYALFGDYVSRLLFV